MTVNISSELLKIFQAHRVVLTALNNNENNGGKTVSHNEVMEFLFSNSPIAKEVEKYMQSHEASLKAIAESKVKINTKGVSR